MSALRLLNEARVHFESGRVKAARQSTSKALRLRPDFAFVHNDLGNALADISGRDDEVLHHYTEAARLLPEFAEAQSNVGTLLKEMQRYPEAAATFEKAIRVKPVLCEAYKNLGSCQQELGRPVDSMRTFRQALDINPQFWPAMYALLDQAHFLCDWKGREGLYRTLRNHLTALQTRGEALEQRAPETDGGRHNTRSLVGALGQQDGARDEHLRRAQITGVLVHKICRFQISTVVARRPTMDP